MAVVRITKELTEQILNNGRAKFKESIEKAANSRPDHHWGDFIYDKIFDKHITTMESLPDGFLPTTKWVTVQSVGGATFNLRFELSKERPWPHALPPEAPAERVHYGDSLKLKDDLIWGEFHAEITAWKERCDKARKQASDFCEGVSKVLESFSTLAPALKAWPPLWELVPEYAKNKHKEISEKRKTKAANEIETDLNKLTALVTASKLGGL